MNFIGIDAGTGGRAIVIDERGQVVASATEEHEAFASPQTGWAEQDPTDWWRAAGVAVRRGAFPRASYERVDQCRRVSPDRCMVPFCWMSTGMCCARRFSGAIKEPIKGAASSPSVSVRRRLIELTSNPALTGFTLPKLIWGEASRAGSLAATAPQCCCAQGLCSLTLDRRARNRCS
ncbi:MAG: FGGY family carbohydrate kinase [Pyrinomonadaceae bacterium]